MANGDIVKRPPSDHDSIFIPLRQAAEAIGAKVIWNQSDGSVSVIRGTQQWLVKPGERNSELNGTPFIMEKTPNLRKGQLFLPIATLNKALKVNISWNPETGISIAPSDVTTKGSYFIRSIMEGRVREAWNMLSAGLRKTMSEASLVRLGEGYQAAYGRLDTLQNVSLSRSAVHLNAHLSYALPSGRNLSIVVRFDHDGKVDDLFIPTVFPDTYKRPEYDRPEAYIEREVTVGEGTYALPGTLTIPKGKGPYPAVVLVHGSGPNDRDNSIGGSKAFRDLAVGLANHNIAVLRYEKRTREHAVKSDGAFFTVQEETVDDALAAVKRLRRDPHIDAKRIYVLGHSQGGMLVPRILEQDRTASIHGALIMAGPSRPLEDIMLWQYEHMLELVRKNGAPSEQVAGVEKQLEFFKTQFSLVKDPKFSPDKGLPGFQLPHPEWWHDFRNYYGGELAKKQTIPMLIAQGDNDMQVSADNLNGWKKALAKRYNVTYKLYPKLNHLFVASDAESTGAEYMLPGNVPSGVIQDFADWINQQP
ncbi:hypothetical protein XI25_06280 [Paenibacillus sp. DMB20]|nr:hypothetical protein XI25_06280 [Paenibacillus sp. DMB20]